MTTAKRNASGNSAVPRSTLRRYPQAFRAYADSRLSEVRLDYNWPLFLGWTVGIAIVLAAAIRVFQAALLGSEHALVGWIAVIPGSILAVCCIGVLFWVYWSLHRAPGDFTPYVVALLTITATILICTEVFAGLTAVLWERGVAGAGGGRDPELWAAEQHYLWHLANAMPLVDAPRTLGWQDSDVFADRPSGIVLLLFKLLVLVPLVQVATAAYGLAEARWHAADEPRKKRPGHWQKLVPRSSAGEAWGIFVVILVVTAAAYLAFVLVGEPTSVVDRLARAHLGGVDALGVHIPRSSLQAGADCVLAAAFLGMSWSMVTELDTGLLRARSFGGLAGAVCGCLALVALATVLAAGTTLALLHVGLAHGRPTIPASNEFDAAFEWLAWHLAEGIPFLDIPSSLGWSLRYEFVDHWSGAIVLGLKLVFFLVVLVPVAWLIRGAIHRLRPGATPQLDAFQDLMRLLGKVRSELDDLGARVLKNQRMDFRDRDNVLPQIYAAARLIDTLEPAHQRVHALFGSGDVSEAGGVAVSAAAWRLETIKDNDWTFGGYDRVRRSLDEARVQEDRAVAEFADLAAAGLRHAAEH